MWIVLNRDVHIIWYIAKKAKVLIKELHKNSIETLDVADAAEGV